MISYGRHEVTDGDIDAVAACLRGDWLTNGPAVEQFEADLSSVCGGVPTVAVSSGTAALHVAYAAACLEPGDEVITPPLTFVATQAAAMHLGVKPIMVDVLPDTGTLDPSSVEGAITERTRAIVGVDYAGHPADWDELREIADGKGLLLIADAAHSLGSTYKGRPVGSLADITTFSFFPTKNITTGEGGAVACQSPELLIRARRFARQGILRDPAEFLLANDGPWHQEVHELGLNYRMADFCAALGSSQLKRLSKFKERRAYIKARYDDGLIGLPTVHTPACREFVDPMWHLYPLRVSGEIRRSIFLGLREAGIGVQVNYIPAYWHPALARLGYVRGACPRAEDFYRQEISLPIHVGLSDSDVDYIVETVRKLVDQTRG